MGRWHYEYRGGDGYHVVGGTSWEAGIVCKNQVAARVFVDSHNADCDAYEQRIAELTAELDKARRALERAGFVDNGAQEWKPPVGWGDTGTLCRSLLDTQDELARVKAESLRVVKDGDAIDVGHAPLGIGFTVDGHSGIFRRVGCGCGGTPIESYVILKRAESDDNVRVPHHTIVQPVMLELWDRPC